MNSWPLDLQVDFSLVLPVDQTFDIFMWPTLWVSCPIYWPKYDLFNELHMIYLLSYRLTYLFTYLMSYIFIDLHKLWPIYWPTDWSSSGDCTSLTVSNSCQTLSVPDDVTSATVSRASSTTDTELNHHLVVRLVRLGDRMKKSKLEARVTIDGKQPDEYLTLTCTQRIEVII